MRKTSAICVAIFLMVTVFSMANGTPEESEAVQETTNLDLNAIYGSTSFHTEGAINFADRVKTYSEGSVIITVHPGGSLGFKGPELLKSVKDAHLPMSDILMGGVAGSEHIFGLSSMPRLVATFEDAKSLYLETKPLYQKAAEKWNQKMLYAAPWPPSGLVTKEAVTDSTGIKGLKTRTYDKNGANFLRELGGAPLALPWGEVYSSLRTGMIDSVLTSAESTKNGKFWEVLNHFTTINYAFPLNMVTINLDYWNDMSKDQQDAILKAADETEAEQWKRSESKTLEALSIIKDNGFVIASPSQVFSDEMDTAAIAIVDEFMQNADMETQTVLRAFR